MNPINESQNNKTHEKTHLGNRTGMLIFFNVTKNEVSLLIIFNNRESNKSILLD